VVRGSGGVYHVNVYRTGREGLAHGEERGHLGISGAAVHRHSLGRLNEINDLKLLQLMDLYPGQELMNN